MLKMTRGNIEASKRFFSSSRNRHFNAASVPPGPPITPRPLRFKNGSALQRELNVLPDSVVEINRRRVKQGLAWPMVEGYREVDLPLPVAGCPGIVGDHRRPTLRICAGGREDANQSHNKCGEAKPPTLHHLRL